MTSGRTAYTVILVEPENPRNIGFVARAMKCSGLQRLCIVSSARRKMEDAAYITGVSARKILREARFFTDIQTAAADCDRVIGFSRRRFSDGPQAVSLPRIHGLSACSRHAALVFGRESSGLSRGELQACDLLCFIPSAPRMSYNLGQAAAVAFYGITQGDASGDDLQNSSDTPLRPTVKERRVLLELFHQRVPKDILHKGNRERFLKRTIDKMDLSADELHMLLGLLKKF
ncbi:MAG: RNA methyltransferase [Fibrobacterota bacterium]